MKPARATKSPRDAEGNQICHYSAGSSCCELHDAASDLLEVAREIRNTAAFLSQSLNSPKHVAFRKAWEEVANRLTPVIRKAEGR